MAHFAFLTVGITSHVNVYSNIGRQLQERGHEITFLSPREEPQALVESRGFRFVLLEEETAVLRATNHKPQPFKGSLLYRLPLLPKLLPYLAVCQQRRHAAHTHRYITQSNELERVLEKIQPDLLLIAYELQHHIIRAAALGLPLMLLETHVSTRRAPNVPILDSTFIPSDAPESPTKAAATWQKSTRRRQLRFGLERLYFGGLDRMSSLRELSKLVGFDFAKRVDYLSQWHFLYFRDLPTLFLSAWEFDFPHEVLDKKSYVGPQVLVEREEPAVNGRFQALMQQVAEDEKRPLIYCAMGSLHGNHNAAFLRRVIGAAEQHPEWTLLMSLGKYLQVEQFGNVPDNVHLFNMVPQLQVLEHADLILTHGGIATINECVLAHVSMLIYSNGFLDRNGNAARVEYHGMGLRGSLTDDVAKIQTNIAQMLRENGRFQQNLQRMATIYRRYAANQHAVNALEAAIAQTKPLSQR